MTDSTRSDALEVATATQVATPIGADAPVAIVGMACRFPRADSLAEFWRMLERGESGVIEGDPGSGVGRFGELFPDAGVQNPACRFGAYLDDLDRFDAAFFRISPVEAQLLDPQQRMMLETSWKALEDAGIDPERLQGTRTGVYAGISNNEYRGLILDRSMPEGPAASLYSVTGTSFNTAIGRVSFAFGIEGPALALDTACSSSLVAIHQAVTGLVRGEADLALAGGVHAILSRALLQMRAEAGMLSPDGRCATFDAAANGYVRGEGCGIVVLKRLEDAEADGDRIWAVVRGSALNQDGASPGLTVPSGPAQEKVIAAALQRAGLEPADVDYVEAHGTGTKVGDPIEAQATGTAYSLGRDPDRPLLIGSVKTNIGHLEAAAGVAGVIKTVLAMKRGVIPKHLNYSTPTPAVDWSRLPLKVTAEPTDWPRNGGRPPRAGISGFGWSGTNAHVVLEGYGEPDGAHSAAGHLLTAGAARPIVIGRPEAIAGADAKAAHLRTAGQPRPIVIGPPEALAGADAEAGHLRTAGSPRPIVADLPESVDVSAPAEAGLTPRRARFLPLSAKSDTALGELAASYLEWLDERAGALADKAVADALLSDMAFTAAVGRSHFDHRAGVVFRDADSLRTSLGAIVDETAGTTARERRKIAFVYTGQASQWPGMGAALYASEPVVRAVLDRCDKLLAEDRDGACLLDVMFGRPGAVAELDDPRWKQPAIYALECALTALWASVGLRPDIVLGHSLGEIAAAEASGVFSLEDGLGFAAARGDLIGALPGEGAMAAIFARPVLVAEAVAEHNAASGGPGVNVAADNATSGGPGVSVAADNGAHQVVSGPAADIETLLARFEADEVRVARLRKSPAYHSAMIEPALGDLEAALAKIAFEPPALPFVSNLSGELLAAHEAPDATYWRRQAREPVAFRACIETLARFGVDAVVEIGPHAVLGPMLALSWPEGGGAVPAIVSSLQRPTKDEQPPASGTGGGFVEAAAGAWEAGLALAFEGLFAGEARRRIALPAYPFQREVHWVRPLRGRRPGAGHPLLGTRHESASGEIVFDTELFPSDPEWLADHRVFGRLIAPGALYGAMAAAASLAECGDTAVVEDFQMQSALVFAESGAEDGGAGGVHGGTGLVDGGAQPGRRVQVLIDDGSAGGGPRVRILSRGDGENGWTLHADGRISTDPSAAPTSAPPTDVEGLKAGLAPVDIAAYYHAKTTVGIDLGPSFRTLNSLVARQGEAVAEVALPPGLERGSLDVHPLLLDGCFQAMGAARNPAGDDAGITWLPFAWERLWLADSVPEKLVCHVRMRETPGGDAASARGDAADSRGDAANVPRDTADSRGDTVDARSDAAESRGDAADVPSDAAERRGDAVDIRSDAADVPGDAAPEVRTADLRLLGPNGALVGEIEGFAVKRATRAALLSAVEGIDPLLYELIWQDGAREPGVLPADFLTPPSDTRASTNLFPQYIADEGVDPGDRAALLADLEQLSLAYALATLDTLGWQRVAGEVVDSETLRKSLEVGDEHVRVFRRLLEMCARAGVLEANGDGFRVVVASDGPLPDGLVADPDAEAVRMAGLYAHGTTEIGLFRRSAAALPDVLQGRMDPLTLLFSSGEPTAADLYLKAPVARAANRLLADATATLLASLPASRKLRIIEVGAGTGSATAAILPELPEGRYEFVYTDISAGFFAEAEARFGGAGASIDYRVLDIEKDPVEQGFDRHGYDLVIASNVLHATRYLNETLAHCLTLLAPSGQVVALENLRGQGWLDLTFGQLDGWWRFADDYRAQHALATPPVWRRALEDAGFGDIAILGFDESDPNANPDRGVIVAQGPAEVTEEAGVWLVAADRGGVAARLAEHLAERNQTVVLAGANAPGGQPAGAPSAEISSDDDRSATQRPDEAPGSHPTAAQRADDVQGSNPTAAHNERIVEAFVETERRESWTSLLDELPTDPPLAGIVHLAGLDGHGAEASTQEMAADTRRTAAGALALTQALAESDLVPAKGLWYVTRGAQVLERERGGELAGATLWGLGKVAARELPQFQPRMFDLDPADEIPAAELADELLYPDEETHVAWRFGRRQCARLVRASAVTDRLALPDEPGWALRPDAGGSLEAITVEPLPEHELEPTEIRASIEAFGLNFRDVFIAIGLVDDFMGGEFCGRVLEVGANVNSVAVGDRVVGLTFRGFASETVTLEAMVAPAPASFPVSELATIPTAFVSAALSFDLAGLKSGDRVLIHAGAGGVGLAAIQLARAAGAEVFATASARKRDYLRSLGVDHVFDSRTTAFSEQILGITDGVDVVLNSLTSEGFIDASLACLAEGGRFVEMSRVDIFSEEEMKVTRPDVSYDILAIDALKEDDPVHAGVILRRVLGRLADGTLQPLRHARWPLAETSAAIKCMRAARHIGKIVLTNSPLARGELRDDRSYLVTGGLGGIGIAIAGWLAERGAGTIVLNGRRAPDAVAESAIEALRGRGATVQVELADVTDPAALDAMFERMDASLPPLGGVIHSVGVLADAAIGNQTWESFETVLWPKVLGAWQLHRATIDRNLDMFVLFSSVAGVLGNPGQSNHAAANAFLDQLAAHRRALGLAGQAIAWGAWSEIGEAEEQRERMSRRSASGGIEWITPQQGLRAFDRLVRDDATTSVVVARDWVAFGESLENRPPLLEDLLAEGAHDEADGALGEDLQSRLQSAPAAARTDVLVSFLQEEVKAVLRLPSSPAPTVGFFDLGMDSLMAVELRNRLNRAFAGAYTASNTVVFDYPDIDTLADHLATELVDLGSGDALGAADAGAVASGTATAPDGVSAGAAADDPAAAPATAAAGTPSGAPDAAAAAGAPSAPAAFSASAPGAPAAAPAGAPAATDAPTVASAGAVPAVDPGTAPATDPGAAPSDAPAAAPPGSPGASAASATEPTPQPAPQFMAAGPAQAIADNAIAVIGMACRFPGAPDLPSFWRQLGAGYDAVSEQRHEPGIRDDYFNELSGHYATYRRAGFVEGIDRFDARFFGIAPIEARLIDPQQRMLLETSWRAFEDAGLDPDGLKGSLTGVYIGIATSEYRDLMKRGDYGIGYLATAASMAAGRLAYRFGLAGPSMPVELNCASSLVAVHQAVMGLRLGEADMALVGGASAVLSAGITREMADLGMLSREGACRTFDASANGFVRGEGCGMVVLKRLADAQADGDRVWAVIRGSAVNQNGATAGATVPNGPAQERVIERALSQAGVAPSEVDYLEAHGAGSAFGDPIELQAAAAAYGKGRDADHPLLVGSVKTNIGHLESAAGIASLVKAVLAMRHGTIPRQLHFRDPSTLVDWKRLPLRVVSEPAAWPEAPGRPPRAGVSAFGISGVNAHIVIEGRAEAARTASTNPTTGADRTASTNPTTRADRTAGAERATGADGATMTDDAAVSDGVAITDGATMTDRASVAEGVAGGNGWRPPAGNARLVAPSVPDAGAVSRARPVPGAGAVPGAGGAPDTGAESPPREDGSEPRGKRLLPLSAKSSEALRALARRYLAWLDEAADILDDDGGAGTALLADMAWTASVGRSHFSHRVAVVFHDADSLRERLGTIADTYEPAGSPATPGDPASAAFPRPEGAATEPEQVADSDSRSVPIGTCERAATEPEQVADSDTNLVEAYASAYEEGQALSFEGLFAGEMRRRIALPDYPFQHRRFWLPKRNSAS